LVKLAGLEKKFGGSDARWPVLWRISAGLTPYPDAVAAMERQVDAIRHEGAPELIWLVEHPPVYTAGTSAKPGDLLKAGRFPVFQTGRGGQYTYHGPGQRVVYLMLDLTKRGKDVRAFVRRIEDWVIAALARLGVEGHLREGRTGIWVARPEKGLLAEDKIAAIGIRVRRWVSFHGVSINVSPDLSHYDGIAPCGIRDQGVTSLADLRHARPMADLDQALASEFPHQFDGAIEQASQTDFFIASSNLKDTGL
jgi:lipoyl(octanoyl) transferase